MIESIIIGVVFIAAIGYLMNKVRKQFSEKTSGCASCSGNCKVSVFEKIND
jgi:hypothetical protein